MSNNQDSKQLIFNHPAGLFILFFTEMWERFSYYGMRALLVLFLVSAAGIGGWEWSNEDALWLYGMYTGLVYLTPILGGFLADKLLGYRNAILIGALLMTLGHASMALETNMTFYLGLFLLVIGNGFFKPNISSVVGELYKGLEAKKDAGYTIFYMGINAGAFLGILFCGYIGEKVGWSYGFGLAGIFMLFGMLQFFFVQKIFGDIGLKPDNNNNFIDNVAEDKNEAVSPKVTRDRLIVIGILSFFTIFFWMAFEQAGGSMTIFAKDFTQRILKGDSANYFLIFNTLITIIPLGIISWVLFKLVQKTFQKYALSNVFLSASFVIIWGIAFWMIQKEFRMKAYEVKIGEVVHTIRYDEQFKTNQVIDILDVDNKGKYRFINHEKSLKIPQSITGVVVKEKINETEVPASWFSVLNSLFIILFAPIFSKIWESKYNPAASIKFAIGLMLLGIGFGFLAWGSSSITLGANTAAVSMWWLILAYLFHTLGELALSPVGLSYISKLSPSKYVGLMFGLWFTATAIANWLAGVTGSFIDKIESKTDFFLLYTAIPIGAGILLIILTPMIKKMMHGIR